MLVRMTVERVFEMDEKRVLEESMFAPPPADATAAEKRKWLQESFFELCGFDRDEDHVDGSYVKNVREDGDTEFVWPRDLRG